VKLYDNSELKSKIYEAKKVLERKTLMPNLTLWEPFADMAIMNSVLFDVLEDGEG
jgi:hypothetical protein